MLRILGSACTSLGEGPDDDPEGAGRQQPAPDGRRPGPCEGSKVRIQLRVLTHRICIPFFLRTIYIAPSKLWPKLLGPDPVAHIPRSNPPSHSKQKYTYFHSYVFKKAHVFFVCNCVNCCVFAKLILHRDSETNPLSRGRKNHQVSGHKRCHQ